MRVRDVMTPSPACCSPTTPVPDVASLMVAYSCGQIPVCDEGNIVGVITDRDITCRVVAAGRNPADLRARDIMTHLVVTVQAEQSIDEAIELMRQEHVLRLPVLEADGKLVGVLSHTDVAAMATPRKVQLLESGIARARRHDGRDFVVSL